MHRKLGGYLNFGAVIIHNSITVWTLEELIRKLFDFVQQTLECSKRLQTTLDRARLDQERGEGERKRNEGDKNIERASRAPADPAN